MRIDGPFNLGVGDIPHALGRELHLPHIEQDEIPLEDTIFIEIKSDFAAGFLNIDGLTSH